jgi:pantoate kinase
MSMASAPAPVPAQSNAKPAKEPRISKRLREAVLLLTTPECKTQKAAAEKLGMSPTYLSEALKKPEVRVFMERTARETVAVAQLRATARMVELMDASSEHVSADMARHVAAIAGIKPAHDAQVSVNIDIKAGYVIDLSEGHSQASGTQLTRAKPIIIENDDTST